MTQFTSRKFVLFAATIATANCGWVYALIVKPEHLTAISTFIVTILGAYGMVNVSAAHLAPTGRRKVTKRVKK